MSNKFNLYCLESNAFRLPASLRTIDSSALSGIAAETIYIPIGVTEIKAKAFANCPYLKTLVFDGSPESISDDMLSGCTDVSILARSGSTAAAWARNHGISVSYY